MGSACSSIGASEATDNKSRDPPTSETPASVSDAPAAEHPARYEFHSSIFTVSESESKSSTASQFPPEHFFNSFHERPHRASQGRGFSAAAPPRRDSTATPPAKKVVSFQDRVIIAYKVSCRSLNSLSNSCTELGHSVNESSGVNTADEADEEFWIEEVRSLTPASVPYAVQKGHSRIAG